MRTDHEGDGLSLDAQRDACTRKADSLGARVVEEFVERGESGKATIRRTALAALLARLKAGDIDYVIVHKVDRLARKRADDSLILAQIQAAGATLVSVTENIDETPSGMLVHGIMASIAEFYSMNLASEVLKGATEKAKRGGTPYRAPLGYRNVRQLIDGHEIRTIAIDPDRGPLITEAFRLYATGDYALSDLAAILEARGLRTPPTPSQPAKAVEGKRLSGILRNPFYMGRVRYRGKVYEERHDRLIDPATFELVQAVLRNKRTAGERPSRWQHHLRGTIVCADCGQRLIYTRSNGNGGTYEYFVCRGRQAGECSQPHHRVAAVEAAIEQHYATVMLSPVRRERIAAAVREYCAVRQQASAPQLSAATTELARLKRRERKLLDAHYEDRISEDLFKEEEQRIRRQRGAAEATIARLETDSEQVLAMLDEALALTDRIQTAYCRADPTQRRLFNQALFAAIWIDNEDVACSQLAVPFDDLLAEDLLTETSWQPESLAVIDSAALSVRLDPEGDPWEVEPQGTDGSTRVLAAVGAPAPDMQTGDPFTKVAGSNVGRMVELRGLEPLTFALPARRSPS